jgi:hypothetical protein
MGKLSGLHDIVHIIPLGHEIDRAVAPFTKNKIDRAYVLAVPADAELDPEMLEKQQYFLKVVTEKLKVLGIQVEVKPVNLFITLDVLKAVSSLIRTEKERGSDVSVNMSACGRKTSVAVTLAAMVQEVGVYYVSANRYAIGPDAKEEHEHGLSIVTDVYTEFFQNFKIMMPKEASILLLVELYNRKISGKVDMASSEILDFFSNQKVFGYEDRHKPVKDSSERAKIQRALLNRTNRGYLKELEDQEYIERKWKGRNFFINITEAGEYIACASGLVEWGPAA